MTDDDKWMPLEDVIQRVMKVKKCSRKAAIKKIADAAKADKLTTKAVPVPPEQSPMQLMNGEEAAQRFLDDPSSVFINLYDFIVNHNFTGKELMGELQSGRLRATGSDVTMFKMQMGEMPHPAEFTVDCQSLINWMANPKTPLHLREKFNQGLSRKPQ